MRKFLILSAIFCVFSSVAFADVTITITDGTETRTISLNSDQEETLNEVMQGMKAHHYKLDEKIQPLAVSGLTELQQVRKIIIEILRGIANQSYRRSKMDTAESEASSYEAGF